MKQLTFNMSVLPPDTEATERRVVEENIEKFRDGFFWWVSENLHVVRGFFDIANSIREDGRTLWAAGEIMFYMRLQTRLAETNSEWKINQNHARDLAMLYTIMHPESVGFFRFKERGR